MLSDIPSLVELMEKGEVFQVSEGETLKFLEWRPPKVSEVSLGPHPTISLAQQHCAYNSEVMKRETLMLYSIL